ncbi:MAG TPA: chitobiase/beta-hexosaminidase C-terminal domain-containing protein [Nitrospirota bacterium]|nr:chitobiase/beta-hexosaminidase C-terminal domain-containing protein [Nitrospirota bacterium]
MGDHTQRRLIQSSNRLILFSIIFWYSVLLNVFLMPTVSWAAGQTVASQVGYYSINDGTLFTRSLAPTSAAVGNGTVSQTTKTDGAVQLTISNSPGYADCGFYFNAGTLGDFSGLDIVTAAGSDPVSVNIWFDVDNNGEFFTWSGNVLSGLSSDKYILGPASVQNVLNVDANSTFNSLIPGGGNYTLAQLKNGAAPGITSGTKIAIWVGIATGGGSLNATVSSLTVNPASVSSHVGYYSTNDGTQFTRSLTPATTPVGSGTVSQTVNADGSVRLTINNSPGYADIGFYLPVGTLGDFNGLDFVTSTGSDPVSINIWFDADNNGEFFTWSGNVLSDLGSDKYILGPASVQNVLNVDANSTFNSLIPGGGNYTLAQLKNGAVAGITSATKIAIWVGIATGGGSLSATVSSLSINSANAGPPSMAINPVVTPTNQSSQTITGTMDAGATIIVTCPTASINPVSYPTTTTWQAMLTNMTEGSNAISVTATNQAGNSDPVVTAIVLDATPPVTTATPPGGVYPPGISVTLVSSETATIYFTTDGTTPTTGSPVYTVPFNFLASTILKYFAIDRAGNSETVKTAAYVINTVPPVRSIAINTGAAYTNSQAVTLALSCSNVSSPCAQMAFSTDNLSWTPLEAYAQTRTWQLSSGDGQKNIYVKYIDTNSNTSVTSAAIILDTEPPLTGKMPKLSKLSAGDAHSVAIAANGALWVWGMNDEGELGDGTYAPDSYPEQIGTDKAWSSVSAGLSSTLALKNDGTLWAWGDNSYGQLGDGTTDAKYALVSIGTGSDWQMISTSGQHSVAIKRDGTLWAWGFNSNGQLGDGSQDDTYVPTRIGSDSDWVSVSAGFYHTVALKSNGTLWAWGYNGDGQLGDGTSDDEYTPVQIGGETDWTAISAGADHTVALKSNGTIWAWGANCHGQLGDGTGGGCWDGIYDNKYEPVQVGSDTNWVSVSSQYYDTMALKSNGSLWAWGANWNGQLGDGTTDDQHTPVQIGTGNTWVAVAPGVSHSLALSADGSLVTWGWNGYGQLGDGSTNDSIMPHVIASIQGSDNPFVINDWDYMTSNASVRLTMNAWDITSGVAFMRFSNDGSTWSDPEPYAATRNWTLSAGDGVKTMYAMFQDAAGNWSAAYSNWIVLESGPPVVTIKTPSAGFTTSNTFVLNYSVSQDTWDTVFLDGVETDFGNGDLIGPLDIGTHTLHIDAENDFDTVGSAEVTFSIVNTPMTVNITSPTAGIITVNNPLLTYSVNYGTVTVLVDGSPVNTASGDHLNPLTEGPHTIQVVSTDAAAQTVSSAVSVTVVSQPTFGSAGLSFVHLAAGNNEAIAVTADGNLWQWGAVFVGGGEVPWVPMAWPKGIVTNHSWATVAAGVTSNLALKTDGSLWAWGSNDFGQLGDGTDTNYTVPIRIGTANDWKVIATGGFHSLAIKKDGTLWAWGLNSYGELGDSTDNWRYAPVKIGNDKDWVAVAAGYYHSVALKSDGTLWAWGANWDGELGDGSGEDQSVPVQVNGDQDWAMVTAGAYHTVAIKRDGTLWTWGANWNGQLGDGTTDSRPATEWIERNATWKAVSAGLAYTVAIKSDGTLWAWGGNSNGQLGDGTTDDKYAPVPIGSDNTWSSIEAGDKFTLAMKADGTLWSWGLNNYGQLGDGTTQSSSVPHSSSNALTLNNTITINEGAYATNNVNVVLKMNVWDVYGPDFIAFMKFSNDGATWTAQEPYGIFKDWMITSGDGEKTVYAMFQDIGGNWSAPFRATILLDTTPPVVTILSPAAGHTNNNMPLLRYTVSDGTVVVYLDSNGTQKLSGGVLDPQPTGTHTVRVEATDAAGNVGSAEVSFTIDPISSGQGSYLFSDVAISSNTLNTAASEQSSIFFTINGPSTVALKIIPEKLGPNGAPVYEMSQVCPAAGPYLFTWDGHDGQGNIVPDEAYLYVLVASDGSNTVLYNPPVPTGTGNISCSQGEGYDPYRNEPLTVSYSVSQPARVNLSINWSGSVFKVLTGVPRAANSYSFDWNGRSPEGRILAGGTATAVCEVASLLGENVIIASGNTPFVSQLKTDPYGIQLSYGEFTRISYALSRDANISIQLISPWGSAVNILNGELQSAGVHIVQWNGIDPSDASGKKLQVLTEGDYTVSVQAVNLETGASSNAKGVLKILN